MLNRRNFNIDRHLVLPLLDEGLDGCNDVLNKGAVAFKFDGRLAAVRTGEFDHASRAAISRATGIGNNFADISTCTLKEIDG